MSGLKKKKSQALLLCAVTQSAQAINCSSLESMELRQQKYGEGCGEERDPGVRVTLSEEGGKTERCVMWVIFFVSSRPIVSSSKCSTCSHCQFTVSRGENTSLRLNQLQAPNKVQVPDESTNRRQSVKSLTT